MSDAPIRAADRGVVGMALRHPHAVFVLIVAIAVLGYVVVLTGRMPSDILPTYNKAAVQVITFYPGMPAEIVEKDITSRIQRWTGQSVGIEHQEAKSMLGVSIVKDFFHDDVSDAAAISQVTSYAMSDLFYLPPGTVPPMTMPFDPTATFPLCLLAVSSQADSTGRLLHDETALYDIAYFQLRNRVQSISGVVAPAVYGGKLRRILGYLDPDRVQAAGLSPMDIVDNIRNNNTFIPVGAARIGGADVLLDSNALAPTVESMDDFPLKRHGSRVLRIGDVADVQDSAEIQSNIVRIDGARQAYIPIYRQPGKNTIAIVDGVKEMIGPIKDRLPAGVDLDVIFDQSVFVRKAIGNLLQEMLFGGLLAAVMILLFLRSWRSTVFILVTLPLAVLSALIGLHAFGQTINLMTLGGLTLVTGLILDEGIVSIENIVRYREMGHPPRAAALLGMQEMARPRLLILITVSVVFFPVIFLSGVGRFLFLPMAIAVALAMFASYVLTMTLVPVLAVRFLAEGERENAGARLLRRAQDGLVGAYGRLLDVALRVRWLTLLGAVGLLGAAYVVLAPRVGQELFPPVDASQLMIRVREEPGTSPDRTEATCADVEAAIQSVIGPWMQKMITNIGVLNDWPAAYTPNSGPGDAFISLQLRDDVERPDVFEIVTQLRKRLRAGFPGVEFSFDTSGVLSAAVNSGVAAPINVQIDGKDLHELRRVGEIVRKRLAQMEGVEDARIQQQLDAPAYRLVIDREKAFRLGLDARDVVQNVVTAFRSSISFAKSFWLDPGNGNHYFVGAQYPAERMDGVEAILEVVMNPGDGRRPVPLKAVAVLERDAAPSEVTHVNITRVVDVFANVEGRDIGSVAAEVDALLADLRETELQKGYAIHNRGEVRIMRESFDGLLFGLALAAALVYLVMVLQFRSWTDPLIVMVAVPLGFVGVLAALLLTGQTLNIQSLMGAIMMVGIVVAFSVLLVDFANRHVAEGMDRASAVRAAAVARFRPIVMTSLAAVLGLLPMALHGGANVPLARAVIGGVLAATVLTLFVVPSLYAVVRGRRTSRPTQEVA